MSNTLTVNIKTLVERVKYYELRHLVLARLVVRLRGFDPDKAGPGEFEAAVGALPETVPYRVARRLFGDRTLLIAVECLMNAGLNPLIVSGKLLLAMARELFLPHLPTDHPGYPDTVLLLSALEGYLDGTVTAEAYIVEAYRYRSRYGTTRSSIGTDIDYEQLFEAMPSGGLDYVLGGEGWGLHRHLESYARFLSQADARHELLTALQARTTEDYLVEDNASADNEACHTLSSWLDEELEAMARAELDGLDTVVVELIDRQMAANGLFDRAAA